MGAGDFGRLEMITNSVRALERRLPYTVDCPCGEKITTETMEPAYCKCGILHRFRSDRE
jgi:hypothetical protein